MVGGQIPTSFLPDWPAVCCFCKWYTRGVSIKTSQTIPRGLGFSAICECLCFCDLLLLQSSEFLGPGPASAVCIDSSARSWVALSSLCAEIPMSHSHASKKFYCVLGKRKRTKQNNFPKPQLSRTSLFYWLNLP